MSTPSKPEVSRRVTADAGKQASVGTAPDSLVPRKAPTLGELKKKEAREGENYRFLKPSNINFR